MTTNRAQMSVTLYWKALLGSTSAAGDVVGASLPRRGVCSEAVAGIVEVAGIVAVALDGGIDGGVNGPRRDSLSG